MNGSLLDKGQALPVCGRLAKGESTSAPFSTESVNGGRPRPPSSWYTKRYDAADGAQSISPDMFDQLMQEVREIAGVLGGTCA
jgi:hypothetical protein